MYGSAHMYVVCVVWLPSQVCIFKSDGKNDIT